MDRFLIVFFFCAMVIVIVISAGKAIDQEFGDYQKHKVKCVIK